MSLRFEHNPPANRLTRGLTNEALDSFNTAYIGGVEFGHYFRVAQSGSREVWRWTINFPVGGADMVGMGESEEKVRDTINALYSGMLEAAGLVERTNSMRLATA